MVKIPADAFRAFTEALAKDTVEDLLIIADGSRRSKITEAETRSLDTGEMMLKRGFAALSEILGPLQNSNSQTADTAYWALYDVMMGAYVIGSRGVVDEIKIVDGPRVGLNREAGKANGEIKKQEAGEWHARALPLARKIRREQPEISQQRLAKEISFTLDDLAPDIPQITLKIRDWERDGSLIKRSR